MTSGSPLPGAPARGRKHEDAKWKTTRSSPPSRPSSWRSSCRASVRRRRSEEHTPELQSLMRISYAVFCLNKKKATYELLHIIPDYKHSSYNTMHSMTQIPLRRKPAMHDF